MSLAQQITNVSEVPAAVDTAIATYREKPGYDAHTHLSCVIEEAGPDACLDYHYSRGIYYRAENWRGAQIRAFMNLPREKRAEVLMDFHFGQTRNVIDPSEAAALLRTTIKVLDVPNRDYGDPIGLLGRWRTLHKSMSAGQWREYVFDKARIGTVVGTEDPFNPPEYAVFSDPEKMATWDPRFKVGLRGDGFVHNQTAADKLLRGLMNMPAAAGDLRLPRVQNAAREAWRHWINTFGRENVQYLSLSIDGKTDLADRNSRPGQFAQEVMIPMYDEFDLPPVIMPFVKRRLNPDAEDTGDIVDKGDFNKLLDFIASYPEIPWLVTPLDRADQYYATFAQRALPNFRTWGYWWIQLTDVMIEDILKMRLRTNGLAGLAMNSDARALDQLAGKWERFYRVLRKVLIEYFSEAVIDDQELTVQAMVNTIAEMLDHQNFLAPMAP